MARVLVVDDEKGMRISLQKFLVLEGHEVYTAEGASKATQILHSKPFDIVITDILLPEITGLDLLLALRSDFPTLKIIMITGEPSVDSASQAVRMGAFDYLAKPISRKDICKVVDSAIKIKILEDENSKYRKELESRVQERTQKVLEYSSRLKEIAENTRQFPVSQDEADLASRVLDLLAKNMEAEGGSFFLRDDNTLRLLCALDPGHQVDAIPLPPKKGSVIWKIFQKKEAFAVNNINENIEIKRSGWNGYKDGSLLALPFTNSDGEIFGMVTLHNKTIPPFSEQDIELGRIIASHTMGNLETLKANRLKRESEERYRALSERSRTGIFVHADGTLVYVNSCLVEMLGFDYDLSNDIMQKSVISYIHPDDRELVTSRIEARLRGEDPPSHYECRLIDKRGNIVWVDMSISMISHRGKPAIMGNMMNITDRKYAEKELEFQAKLIDQLKDSVVAVDMDGKVTYVNEIEIDASEYSKEEFLNMQIHDLGIPHKKRVAERENDITLAFDQTLKHGEWEGNLIAYTKSGKSRILKARSWLLKDENNESYGAIAIATDITEHKNIEEAYKALVNNSLLGLAVFQNQKIIFANKKMESITGCTEQELLNFSREEILSNIHSDDYEYLEKVVLPEMYTREPTTAEFRIVRKDGTVRWLNSFTSPIEFNGLPAFQIAYHDNTDKKIAEESKLSLEEELRYSQKMDAIGRLAGGVAHDFNNLLTGISGNASLAKYELDKTSPAYAPITEILQTTRRASSLTNQLLVFSSKKILETGVHNLNSIVVNMEKILKSLIGEDVELIISACNQDINIEADLVQIEQVILNLVVNGKDAMPDGGRIDVKTSAKTFDEETIINHVTLPKGKYAVVSVVDTGAGMSEETISHIFEPFFTTRRKQGGTGLGMSTAYGIIKQHKGAISISSKPNEGSEFKVYFPLCDKPVDEIDIPFSESKMQGGSETILVVEDDEIVKDITVRILERVGYTAIAASNGEEALEKAKEIDYNLQLLVLDIIMPGMDGFQLAEKFKNEHNINKVLYISGYAESKIADRGVALESIAFLKKPFSPESLASSVRELLDKTEHK